ncbi:MAG: type II toxin-antitoxin system RelE/ParE family toxin [bacterium]
MTEWLWLDGPFGLTTVLRILKSLLRKIHPKHCKKIIKGILNQIDNPAHCPKIGKAPFSSDYPNLRVFIWNRYKIYYEYRELDDVVEIWGIWDSRSMLPDFK